MLLLFCVNLYFVKIKWILSLQFWSMWFLLVQLLIHSTAAARLFSPFVSVLVGIYLGILFVNQMLSNWTAKTSTRPLYEILGDCFHRDHVHVLGYLSPVACFDAYCGKVHWSTCETGLNHKPYANIYNSVILQGLISFLWQIALYLDCTVFTVSSEWGGIWTEIKSGTEIPQLISWVSRCQDTMVSAVLGDCLSRSELLSDLVCWWN